MGLSKTLILIEACGVGTAVNVDFEIPWQTLVEKTDVLCKPELAKAMDESAPRERLQKLLAECGAEHFGLPAGAASYLTMEWFLVQRSMAWIHQMKAKTDEFDSQLAEFASFRAPMSMPTRILGSYVLPESAHSTDYFGSRELGPTRFVLIQDESIKLIKWPVVKWGDQGAILEWDKTGGRSVELDELDVVLNTPEGSDRAAERAAFEESAAKLAEIEAKSGEAKQQAMDQARKAGVLGLLAQSPNGRYAEFGGGSLREARFDAPLLGADKATSAQRVLKVIDTIREQGVHLAVAGKNQTNQATVSFGNRGSAALSALTECQILLADSSIEVWTDRKHEIPKADGQYNFQALREYLQEVTSKMEEPTSDGFGATLRGITISSGQNATYADLIAVLDVAVAAGFGVAATGPMGSEIFRRPVDENIYGGGVDPLGVRRASPPTVRLGPVSAAGDLSRDVIQQHIRKQLPRIRHCYERELINQTDLEGTIRTEFQISPRGEVQGVSAKGLGNKNVERCVAKAIKLIEFPQPAGGGYVNVTYPFNFQLP
jgi:biopolymer transport protein ExbD